MNFKGDSRINEGERGSWGEWGGGGGSVRESSSILLYRQNLDHHGVNFMNEFQRRQ